MKLFLPQKQKLFVELMFEQLLSVVFKIKVKTDELCTCTCIIFLRLSYEPLMKIFYAVR